jgi:hypothetical protein
VSFTSPFVLSVVMLSVVMLNVVILSVIMVSVVMLSVAAPKTLLLNLPLSIDIREYIEWSLAWPACLVLFE